MIDCLKSLQAKLNMQSVHMYTTEEKKICQKSGRSSISSESCLYPKKNQCLNRP